MVSQGNSGRRGKPLNAGCKHKFLWLRGYDEPGSVKSGATIRRPYDFWVGFNSYAWRASAGIAAESPRMVIFL